MTNPKYLFKDIGYHFGIELIGDYYEVLIGRELDEIGAHCPDMGMNRKGIGVCAVGNYDITAPPSLLLARTLRLVSSLQETWKIRTPNVLGHRETGAPKSCPGKLWDMAEFRKQL
jgi:N-acetylmuramoyl-L-alanine amidase